MSRLASALLLAVVTLGASAPAANAAQPKKLDANLGAMWTKILETPKAQNPFGDNPPGSSCIDLGGTVAPFGPSGVTSCTVKSGTKIFVAASSNECSTPFEVPPPQTEAQLRECARKGDASSAPTVTLDNKPVSIAEVETRLLTVVLPKKSLFNFPAGTHGKFVGHGWVSLLHPLTPGTHTIKIGTDITTTIIVKPGGGH